MDLDPEAKPASYSTAPVQLIGVKATRPVWALIGGLVSVIIAGASVWLTQVQAREGELNTQYEAIAQDGHQKAERLARIEGKIENTERGLQDLRDIQRRMDDKLDRLLSDRLTTPPRRPTAEATRGGA